MVSPATIKMAKANFFDRPKVKRRVDRVRRAALSKGGAFIRTTAKGLIRSGKNVSNPGAPPKSHTGELRQHIYFSHDASTDGVVIGAALFGVRRQPVPGLLEHGGTIKGKAEFTTTTLARDAAGKFRSDRRRVTTKLRRYRPRPFMFPALQKNVGKLPKQFQNRLGSG